MRNAISLALVLAILSGCGGDDPSGPGGANLPPPPGMTPTPPGPAPNLPKEMTAEELEAEIAAAGKDIPLVDMDYKPLGEDRLPHMSLKLPESAKAEWIISDGLEFQMQVVTNVIAQFKDQEERTRGRDYKLIGQSGSLSVYAAGYGFGVQYKFEMMHPIGHTDAYICNQSPTSSREVLFLMIKCARTLRMLKPVPDDPVKALEQLGWSFGVEDGEVVSIRDGHGVDRTLKLIEDFKKVRSLRLIESQVTDAGLAHMAGMTEMQNLSITSDDVTGSGLKHLAGMTKLTKLSLLQSEIDDEGLANLPPLPLTYLCLQGTAITDAGLTHLAKFTELEELDLQGGRIVRGGGGGGTALMPGPGLKHLAGMTKLENLNLNSTALLDDGLVHLPALPSLKRLNLGDTSVTDKGLAHLTKFTKLESLNLERTQVTDAGVAALKKALPALSVYR